MNDNPILTAIKQTISLKEGLAEFSSDNTLEVVLPPEVADTLEVREDVIFTTSAEERSGYFVTYNSDILEKFEKLLGNSGYVATLGIKYEGHLKPSGFDKLVASSLHPQNGLIRFLEAKPALTPYILCNIAYTAAADEKRVGMTSFFINGITGCPGVDVGDALLWETDRIEADIEENPIAISVEELSRIIEKTAKQAVNREIEPWKNSLERKQNRDTERLKNYYGEIAAEINRKIGRKRLEGEDKEKELTRIAATKKELERKQKEMDEKYALSIESYLHSSLVIMLQTVRVECELKRKKHRRNVTAIWNPYTKQIEPLRCEKLNVPVTSFYLGDDGAEIFSEEGMGL
jgi:hypothetical protein